MSNDRDDELGAALRALPTPEHDFGFWEELEERLAGEPAITRLSDRQRKRRPFPGTWLLSVAAAVALVVGTVAVLANDDDDKKTRIDVTATTRPRPEGPARWTNVPEAPLPGRTQPVLVWTGSKVIAWGGRGVNGGPLDDGAVYDPARQRWTAISRSPVALEYARGVWAGDRMLVWGMTPATPGQAAAAKATGLSYDPASDRWSRLRPSPLATVGDQGVAWTGERMIVWGGSVGESAVADGASYDPATDTWEQLPPAPLPGRLNPTVAWVDDRLIVWGGSAGEEGSRVNFTDGASYDPATRTWTKIADAPGGDAMPATLLGTVWTGAALVAVGDSASLAYSPADDRWTPLEGFPLAARVNVMVEAAGGYKVVAWGGQASDGRTTADGAVLDVVSGKWTALPGQAGSERAGAGSVSTGSAAFFWGGVRGGSYVAVEALKDGAEFHAGD